MRETNDSASNAFKALESEQQRQVNENISMHIQH